MIKLELAILSLVGALAAAGCTTDLIDEASRPAPAATSTCLPLELRSDLSWYGTNAKTLTGWLDARGCASPTYDLAQRPVALFDWDNTILKNDIGDAITFHLVAHDLVLQPPNQDWKLSIDRLIVCGNEGATEEEIWVRQLGAWMYLPGVTEGSNLSLLCSEARHIAERLSRSATGVLAPAGQRNGHS